MCFGRICQNRNHVRNFEIDVNNCQMFVFGHGVCETKHKYYLCEYWTFFRVQIKRMNHFPINIHFKGFYSKKFEEKEYFMKIKIC